MHYNETAGLPTAAPAAAQPQMMAAYPYAQPAVAKLQSLAKRWMPARLQSGGGAGEWGARWRGQAAGGGGAGNVPLISVSQHDDSLPADLNSAPPEQGVLFDADEGQGAQRRSSSLSDSSGDEGLDDSDAEEQERYEARRKERRGKYQKV